MSNSDKDIEITNIKRFLIQEYDFLIIGGCTDKQRRVADVLRETIDRIAEIQRNNDND